jgi:hypothetical protein
MGDAEVFGKLSRIFETHGFSADDDDLDNILDDFDPTVVYSTDSPRSPSKTKYDKMLHIFDSIYLCSSSHNI